jgi:hypothetical protein
MSDLCGIIITKQLPMGSSKEKVLGLLGKPDIDLGHVIMYMGGESNWVHNLLFKDNKLVKYDYSVCADLEQ